VALGPAAGVGAQEVVSPESVGLSSSRLAAVTAVMEEFVEAGNIAGAVAGVSRHGGVAYLGAAGFQDLATQTPMTDRSLCRIYSMSKAVTSVAVMMLWEEGRVGLDDSVSRYLPDFSRVQVRDEASGNLRPPIREITIRDLLLHTSGLNHRTSALYRDLGVRKRDIPMAEFIQNIVAAPLMEDPGTRYRYSEATTVLGGLVEVWSGRPLDEFLDDRIFGPLGMVDTGFQVRSDQLSRLATAYRREGDDALVPFELEEIPFTERPALLEGAVGLVSTVPDYLRFAQMLLNGGELDGVRILSAETVETITANGLSDDVLAARPGGSGWGLGNVNVSMEAGGGYGWDGSAGTVFFNDPATDTVIVLMWQNSPANPGSLRQRLQALVREAIVD
jgi:CubicO group peptidase (beta-lactamase class C family)